jgi:RND family efflux transporter MFP subunit
MRTQSSTLFSTESSPSAVFELTKVFRPAALIVSVALLVLSGCRSNSPVRAEKEPVASKIAVTASLARERVFIREAEGQGALYAKEKATIAPEVAGRVAEIVADLGDKVEKGQVLLRIAPREYQIRVDSEQAALNQTKAQLTNAQSQFDRAKGLRQEKMIAPQQFDQLAAALKIAQANVEAAAQALAMAQKKLGDTEVKAPFNGYIQKRLTSLGEFVNPQSMGGSKLYEIVAIDPIKLLAPIPERHVPLLKTGLKVEVVVAAKPDQVYEGEITRMAPALDEASRTLLVEAEVRNPDGVLKPGYFAHIKLSFGEDRGLFVPQSAVMRYAGVERVFVIENGIAHSREVKTGARQNDQIEIISGIKAGEKVATSETDRLAEGSAVNAQVRS